MNYIPTIHVKKCELTNKFFVCAGLLDYPVGDKNNYFPKASRDATNSEVKAQAHLGGSTFPKGENSHDTEQSAREWMTQYKKYAERVISMPSSLKEGHACKFWK